MKFTFIMPAFNAEKTIERAVRSIMMQTYRELQIIVIDDGSKDGTLSIIRSLSQEDARIEYYHKENGGIGSAYIMAFEKVRGDYVLFLDSDDYVSNNLVEIVKKTIDDTDADVVQFGRDLIGEDRHVYHRILFDNRVIEGRKDIVKDYFYGILNGTNFPGLSIRAIRASLLEGFNYYSSSYAIDEILTVHISLKSNKITFIPGSYYTALRYTTSVSHSPVSTKKVIGQYEGLTVISSLVSQSDEETQALAAIKLLSVIITFYPYFVNGYGKEIARQKIKELYSRYSDNRKLVKIPIKTRLSMWCVRFLPCLIVIKNKLARI